MPSKAAVALAKKLSPYREASLINYDASVIDAALRELIAAAKDVGCNDGDWLRAELKPWIEQIEGAQCTAFTGINERMQR